MFAKVLVIVFICHFYLFILLLFLNVPIYLAFINFYVSFSYFSTSSWTKWKGEMLLWQLAEIKSF